MPIMRDATNDARNAERRTCARCVMDTSDPDIRFDDAGVCNHCGVRDAMVAALPRGEAAQAQLAALVADIRAQASGDVDCLIGMSGGVDSSYVAVVVKRLGLR